MCSAILDIVVTPRPNCSCAGGDGRKDGDRRAQPLLAGAVRPSFRGEAAGQDPDVSAAAPLCHEVVSEKETIALVENRC